MSIAKNYLNYIKDTDMADMDRTSKLVKLFMAGIPIVFMIVVVQLILKNGLVGTGAYIGFFALGFFSKGFFELCEEFVRTGRKERGE